MVISLPAHADCSAAYRHFRTKTRISPISTPLSSSAQTFAGGVSSTGGSLLGTSILNTELSTAGFLYGAAFFYEGQYGLEESLSDIRQYRSRMLVYKILKEARRGFGDHLDDFIDDLKDSTLNSEEVSNQELVASINLANDTRVFCPKGKQLFNLKNLSNYLLTNLAD